VHDLRTPFSRMRGNSANVGETVGVGHSESGLWVVLLVVGCLGRMAAKDCALCLRNSRLEEGGVGWRVLHCAGQDKIGCQPVIQRNNTTS